MSVTASLLVLAASVAALMGAIALVRRAGTHWSWHAEVSRKAVHVAIGLYALVLPLLFDARWPVVCLILMSLALMAWLRRPTSRASGLGATIHAVERRSFGDVWLALAIGFVFLQSEGRYIVYALPIAIIAISDAAAALTGTSYGRMRFAIQGGVKSWEGVVAFFAVTLIIAMVMLLLLTDVPRINVVVLSLTVATFAATVEAVSWRGLDNLFVPIATHLFLSGWLYAPPLSLLWLGLAFLAAVLLVVVVSSRLGLGDHFSRALVIAAFAFLGTAGIYGTVLPALVLAAHLVARRVRPSPSNHADLDVVATVSAAGLIWFFIGGMVGPSAINLYNAAMAGMLLGYVWIAFPALACRVLAPVGTLGVLFVLVENGPDYARWVSSYPAIASATLALMVPCLALRSEWFDRWRAPRLAAVSSIVPLCAYFLQTVTS